MAKINLCDYFTAALHITAMLYSVHNVHLLHILWILLPSLHIPNKTIFWLQPEIQNWLRFIQRWGEKILKLFFSKTCFMLCDICILMYIICNVQIPNVVNPSAIQRHFYNAKRFAVILGSELWQMEKKLQFIWDIIRLSKQSIKKQMKTIYGVILCSNKILNWGKWVKMSW